ASLRYYATMPTAIYTLSLHDALPILNKEGALTPEEFEHVQQHVLIGSQILAPLSHLGDIIPAVRGHHERWDGTGYPDGLRGEAIPIPARILAAAEVYDALSTSRAYQEKMTADHAVQRMADLSGTVLDPAVYDALATIVGGRGPRGFLTRGGATPPWVAPEAAA